MADIQRVPSGIPGLDDLIEGGFWPKSTVVILGSSGTGKSTFAVQFLMEGIEQGEQALYVTLEEPPEQIMREADLMGFDMRKYYEKSLFFIHLKGQFQEDDRGAAAAARQGARGLQHQDASRDRPDDAGHLGDRGET